MEYGGWLLLVVEYVGVSMVRMVVVYVLFQPLAENIINFRCLYLYINVLCVCSVV
jgi:hypothetical protein